MNLFNQHMFEMEHSVYESGEKFMDHTSTTLMFGEEFTYYSSMLSLFLFFFGICCIGCALKCISKIVMYIYDNFDFLLEETIMHIYDCVNFAVKSLTVSVSVLFCIFILITALTPNKNNLSQQSIDSENPFQLINNIYNYPTKQFDTFDMFDYNKNIFVADKFNLNFNTKNNLNENQNNGYNKFKKNLIVYNFDEVFTSHPSTEKFESVNNFVNLVIRQFENKQNITDVAIILTSGGGNALFFERAYSNLRRLSSHGFKTYAVIDTVCASGCYMMACACDKIIAGNSSTIGSIGVYTKRYNAEQLGKTLGVQELIFKTSDKKGDIPLFGHVDNETIKHIQNKLDKTMKKFSSIVHKTRPNVDPKYFDADVWYAEEAIEYKLIDKIQMKDDFIKEMSKTHNIFVMKETSEESNNGKGLIKTATKIVDKILDNFDDYEKF